MTYGKVCGLNSSEIEVLLAVLLWIRVFWDTTLWRMCGSRCFEGTQRLLLPRQNSTNICDAVSQTQEVSGAENECNVLLKKSGTMHTTTERSRVMIWFMTVSSKGILWMRWWNSNLNKCWKINWVSGLLLAAQGILSSNGPAVTYASSKAVKA